MTNINVEFNLKTVTEHIKFKLTSSIIDLLLYYRKQIPFSYNLFEKILDNKMLCASGADWGSFKAKQQRTLAKETLDSIVSLKKDLNDTFKDYPEIQEVLILFGSTLATPLESYLIKLPATRKSSEEISFCEEQLRQILLQLVQCGDLDIKNIRTTNMFVLIRNPLLEPESLGDDITNFKNLGNFRVPASCQLTTINLINVYNSNFSIFQEFENLSMHETSTTTEIKIKTEIDNSTSWHQSQIIVKGFKDVLINNKSIWN